MLLKKRGFGCAVAMKIINIHPLKAGVGSRDIIQVSRTRSKGAELLIGRTLGSGEALGRVMPCAHHSLHPREEAGLFCPGHSP